MGELNARYVAVGLYLAGMHITKLCQSSTMVRPLRFELRMSAWKAEVLPIIPQAHSEGYFTSMESVPTNLTSGATEEN